MCAALDDIAGRDDAGGVPAPIWLKPLADQINSLAASWAGRCGDVNTRLREAEIRRRLADAEREHAEAILDSLRDGVLVTDPFNEITVANQRAAILLGFDREHALRGSIDAHITDERVRGMIRDMSSAGVLSKQKYAEHTMPSEPGGGPADFDLTISCLGDGSGELSGVVTIFRDVTREREISRMKSDFVSQASHELRTPLSAINAYVEMLLDGEAADEAGRQEFYGIIRGEAERVTRMIDNMLNISRIEAGIHSVERAEHDFVKICREVAETMQRNAKLKNIGLSVKSGPLVYTAECDRDMIYQVVMNLVSNAIKYTPDGGRVTLAVENDDTTRGVMVTINDTGLGIPPDAIEKVFEKFYRIENYKRVAKGTGLGLNLCRHIVETVHGGRIGVTSEMGMGSRFWFTIPYEADAAQPTRRAG